MRTPTRRRPRIRTGCSLMLGVAALATIVAVFALPVHVWLDGAVSPVPGLAPVAAEVLETRGKDAVPAVVDALLERRSGGPRANRAALTLLDRLDPAAELRAAALLEVFESADRRQRERALRAVGWIGVPPEAVLPALRTRAREANADPAVLRALGSLGEDAAPALPELVALLERGPTTSREHAARTIGRLGEAALPALPALLEALGDPATAVVSAAAQALRNLGPLTRPVAMELVGLASADGCTLRHGLTVVAAEADPAGVAPLLTDLLDSTTERCRGSAAWTFWRVPDLGTPRALRGLAALLGDPDPYVRRMAARGLARTDPATAARSLDTIVAMLDDPDEWVRLSALDAFALMGPHATPAARRVEEHMTRSDDAGEAQFASRALWNLGDPRSVTALLALLESERWREHPHVEYWLIEALGRFGAEANDALPFMEAVVSASIDPAAEGLHAWGLEMRRFAAAEALTRVRPEACATACTRRLAWGLWSYVSHDQHTQLDAAEALERLGRAPAWVRTQLWWRARSASNLDIAEAMRAALDATDPDVAS